MSLIQQTLLDLLPPNRKTTPSGWTSFNAVCCHHRGQRMDDRKRGGVMLSGDSFNYHCFNCGFKAGWGPGKLVSSNTRKLFGWLGLADVDIQKLALEALKNKSSTSTDVKKLNFDLPEIDLPKNSKKITEIEHNDPNFIQTVQYILDRGMSIDWYDWMWSPDPGYKNRLIIPFYHNTKIVGFTARLVGPGKPKYITHANPGYVFNLSGQPWNRKYLIVTEGQLDAIAIDGAAIMHNQPNEQQIIRINNTAKEIIVVPDRDLPGTKLIDTAMNNKWSISVPPWHKDIKDVADAVKIYGRLYTLISILHYKEHNYLKQQLIKKKIQHEQR